MAAVVLGRFSGTANPEEWSFQAEQYFAYLGFPENDWLPLPFLYLDGEALDWFRWMYRNEQFWDWKHFKEKLALHFRARTSSESPLVHSQITSILTLLQKMLDNYSIMSTKLDNIHVSTSNIFNLTGFSPTIIQEVAEEDATDKATTEVSEEIASALGDGHSSIANDFEVHLETFDTLIDTNHLLAGTNSVMEVEHSGHADQVFDKSSHQIENSDHEFDMEFDLITDNLAGSRMPLQVTLVISKPTWCAEIDYPNDTHSRKSIAEEDECLDINTDIVFDGSLWRNKFEQHCQFSNLKLVVTDNTFSHEISTSNFDGDVFIIPHNVDAEIAEFFPCVFNQSSLADFGDLAMCESVTDGLPTCYWFDTGQHVSQFIPFVFRLKKYGDHLSATEFDKNGYRPVIGAQGGDILNFAIRCSSCYSSGDGSNIAWKGPSHNWLLDTLARYILDMESGNSKMDLVFDAMYNEAIKVFSATSTFLPVGVLDETHKEMETVLQFHFKDRACFLLSFGGRESIASAAHSIHALPMRYIDANSLYSVLSRQKIDLVASNDMFVDTIFMKPTMIEDLYLDKLFFENKGGVSESEIQCHDVRNDVKHEKFNEGIRRAECLFPVDPGANLFMIELGRTVKVNYVWDLGINSKIMHHNGLMETIEAHLLLKFVVTFFLLFNYFYDAHLKGNTQSKERRKTILRGLFIFPYLWLSLSQDNGWQVLLDVCALGAKDMPLLSAKISSQIVSYDLVLFGTNSLFQVVLNITMPLKEPLGAWGDKNLTVEGMMEYQNVSTDQCAYWCLTVISTDEISFWVDTIVCPMININCMCAFECIYVTGIVTCKWFKVVQPIKVVHGYRDNLQLPETIGEERGISIVIALNLEDKVLIEDGSIVMNQPRPNVDIYMDVTQLVIGPRRSNRIGPSQRLIWDPGPINNKLKRMMEEKEGFMKIVEKMSSALIPFL